LGPVFASDFLQHFDECFAVWTKWQAFLFGYALFNLAVSVYASRTLRVLSLLFAFWVYFAGFNQCMRTGPNTGTLHLIIILAMFCRSN